MMIGLAIFCLVAIACLGYLLIYSDGADDDDSDTDDYERCGDCESYNRWFCCCDETNGYRRPSDRCNARKQKSLNKK